MNREEPTVHSAPEADATLDPALASNSVPGDATPAPRGRPSYAVLGRADTVLGEYRLKRFLGNGTFGEVWTAVHVSLDSPDAIPICLKLLYPDRSGLGNALAEAQAMAAVQHVNVVGVRKAGRVDGTGICYVEMDLVAGVTPGGELVPAQTLAEAGVRDGRPQFAPAEAAGIVAGACNGIHAAHLRGRFHRDVKPENILLEPGSRRAKVADFGIAAAFAPMPAVGAKPAAGTAQVADHPGALRTDASPRSATGPGVASPGAPRRSGSPIGTPAFMAPEQAQGEATQLSDVYGLGAVLYFLLSGGPPHVPRKGTPRDRAADDVLEQLRAGGLAPGASRVPPGLRGLERTLWKVALKAMAPRPEDRYQSALQMAGDLEAALAYRPTLADPPRPWRRVRLACRRNRGRVAASLALAAGVLAAVSAWAWNAAQARELRRQADAQALRDQQLRVHVLEHQQLRLGHHQQGWSRAGWDLIAKAAALHRDVELRSNAAANLAGVDAAVVWRLNSDASSVALNPACGLLAMGGVGEAPVTAQSKLLDVATGEVRRGRGPTADGPVAFAAAERAVQLVRARRNGLLLVDVKSGEQVRVLKSGLDSPAELWVLTPDASHAAATFRSPADPARHKLVVWDVGPGDVRREFDLSATTALALSPDARFVAAGGEAGITLVPLADGVTVSQSCDSPVQSLAFGHDPVVGGDGAASGWLLAAGDIGGTVTVYDIPALRLRAICRGSYYEVRALAFSPDGTLLASAGRNPARLWDASTGRHLLDLTGIDFATGLTFSSDGRRLATASVSAFSPGETCVWDVEQGRGIRTLRGLKSQVAKVIFSEDNRRLAALSHDWRVGVWQRGSGALEFVLDAPRGNDADNAAIALSPDGRRLGVVAGTRADLWDIPARPAHAGPPAQARRLASWPLPEGLNDLLGFDAEGRLVSFRMETVDNRPPYNSINPWSQHPRVCRIRRLLVSGGDTAEARPELVAEIPDFNRYVFSVAGRDDASWFAAEGLHARPGQPDRRKVKVFDGATGREMWSRDLATTYKFGSLFADSAGRRLMFRPEDKMEVVRLLDLATSTETEHALPLPPSGLHPDGQHWLSPGGFGPRPPGMSLVRSDHPAVVVRLGLDQVASSRDSTFSSDGAHAAWGNIDGTVTLCDLAEVRRRLAELNLDWSGPLGKQE